MQAKTKKGAALPAQTKPASSSVPEKGAVPEKGKSLDVHAVKALIEAVEKSTISRFVWQRADEKLCIVRKTEDAAQAALPPTPSALLAATDVPAAASAAPAEVSVPQGHVIASPFVGTFYRAPGPEQPPFVEMGSNVRKGQTLCIVEAMKLMNEIEADVSGKVVAILVDNAQPVEFGQALFRLEPGP